MSPSIEDLQRQIAALQGKQVETPVINEVKQVADTPLDLKSLIKETLREELASLRDSSPVVQPIKQMTLLESIGLGLTQEEQLWLSKPDVLSKVGETLPKFFQTDSGKETVRSFLNYFQGTYEA